MHISSDYTSAGYAAEYFRPTAKDHAVFQPMFHGSLMKDLKLTRFVDYDTLRRVLSFVHPRDGTPLRNRKGNKAGFGYILPAGKGASLLSMADGRIAAAFVQTVAMFLRDIIEPSIEINMAASLRPDVPSGRMLAVSRVESFNRDGECFLHADLLIVSLTRDPATNEWRAASVARIDRDIVLLRQAFIVLWARERAKLGYTDFVKRPDAQCLSFEAAEIPPDMLDRHSLRSAYVREQARQNLIRASRSAADQTGPESKRAEARQRHWVATRWDRPTKREREDFVRRFLQEITKDDRNLIVQARDAARGRVASLKPAVDERQLAVAALTHAAEYLESATWANCPREEPVPWALTESQLLLLAFQRGPGLPTLAALRALLVEPPESFPVPRLEPMKSGLWTSSSRFVSFDALQRVTELRPFIPGPSPDAPAANSVGNFVGVVGLEVNHLNLPRGSAKLQADSWVGLIREAGAQPGQLLVLGQNRWTQELGLSSTLPPKLDVVAMMVRTERSPECARSNPLVLVAVQDPALSFFLLGHLLATFGRGTRVVLMEETSPVEANKFETAPSMLGYLKEHHGLAVEHTARTRTVERELHRQRAAFLSAAAPGPSTVRGLVGAGLVDLGTDTELRAKKIERIVTARRHGRTSTLIVENREEADRYNAEIHALLVPKPSRRLTTLRRTSPEVAAAFAAGRLPPDEVPVAAVAIKRLPCSIPCGTVFALKVVTGGRLVATDKSSRLTLLLSAALLPKLYPLEQRTLAIEPGAWVTPTIFASSKTSNGMFLVMGHPYRIDQCEEDEIRFKNGQILRLADNPAGLELDLAYARPMPTDPKQWPKIRLHELIMAVPVNVFKQRGGLAFYRECMRHSSAGAVLGAPDFPALASMLDVALPAPACATLRALLSHTPPPLEPGPEKLNPTLVNPPPPPPDEHPPMSPGF